MNQTLLLGLIATPTAIITFLICQWTKKPWIPYFIVLVVVNSISAAYEMIENGYISGWWWIAHYYLNGYLITGVCIGHFAWYGYTSKSRNNDPD